jgi:hypothetical protein
VFRCFAPLAPSTVFAPAPAFAEGAGALHYKVRHGGRLVMMDDAWSVTDQRGWLTRWVKRIFYGYVDGGFFPTGCMATILLNSISRSGSVMQSMRSGQCQTSQVGVVAVNLTSQAIFTVCRSIDRVEESKRTFERSCGFG